MTNIIERLRFDEARCKVLYSKGIASNIKEAADATERLTAVIERLQNIMQTDRDRLQSEGDLGAASLIQTYLNEMHSHQQQPPRSWTEAKNEVAGGWPDE
jgi:hypothetical protein